MTMSDITMCADHACPSAVTCRRSPVSGSQAIGRQDWFGERLRAKGQDRCDQYWPAEAVTFSLDVRCVMGSDGTAAVRVALSGQCHGTALFQLDYALSPFPCDYGPEAQTVGFLAGNYLLHLMGSTDTMAMDQSAETAVIDLAALSGGLSGLPAVAVPTTTVAALAAAARAKLAVNAPGRAAQMLPSSRYPGYPAEAAAMLVLCGMMRPES